MSNTVAVLVRSVALAVAVLVGTPASAANAELEKPIKTLINSIRYSKDKNALKLFASEEQARILTTDDWEKATPEQRKEFIELFQTLFGKIAFPKLRENFKHLGAMQFDSDAPEGNKAQVGSTLVIDHPLKKQEFKLKYSLVKEGAAWKVADVKVMGSSMLTDVRDEQVKPILKEGGWPKLLEVMREKAKELEKVPLK